MHNIALPPILVLTITASVAAKLKDSLTAVILRAIQNYMEKAHPTLLSGLTHALVHTLHGEANIATPPPRMLVPGASYQWRVDAQPDSSNAASVAVPASEDLTSTEPSYTERRCSGSI